MSRDDLPPEESHEFFEDVSHEVGQDIAPFDDVSHEVGHEILPFDDVPQDVQVLACRQLLRPDDPTDGVFHTMPVATLIARVYMSLPRRGGHDVILWLPATRRLLIQELAATRTIQVRASEPVYYLWHPFPIASWVPPSDAEIPVSAWFALHAHFHGQIPDAASVNNPYFIRSLLLYDPPPPTPAVPWPHSLQRLLARDFRPDHAAQALAHSHAQYLHEELRRADVALAAYLAALPETRRAHRVSALRATTLATLAALFDVDILMGRPTGRPEAPRNLIWISETWGSALHLVLRRPESPEPHLYSAWQSHPPRWPEDRWPEPLATHGKPRKSGSGTIYSVHAPAVQVRAWHRGIYETPAELQQGAPPLPNGSYQCTLHVTHTERSAVLESRMIECLQWLLSQLKTTWAPSTALLPALQLLAVRGWTGQAVATSPLPSPPRLPSVLLVFEEGFLYVAHEGRWYIVDVFEEGDVRGALAALDDVLGILPLHLRAL